MKRIKIIEKLINKAEETGYASLSRNGTKVYEVEVTPNGFYKLKHYGTETLYYDKLTRHLIHYYGESVSDRDSMNTFLSYLGEHRYYFRYGPVMGFVMEEVK